MKKILNIFLYLIFFSHITTALDVGDVFQLPEPEIEGGMPLFEALNKRQTSRNFDPLIKLTPQILSQALWSCYGENRPKGYKTTPSATAWYPLTVYVFLEEGVFTYDATEHTITKIIDGDYRNVTGTQQSIVTKASANFVLIGDLSKKSSMDDDEAHKLRSIYLDSGHCTMALYLFAAANDLKAVVRGMVDVDPLFKLLDLTKEDHVFSLAFSLGY